MRRHPGSLTHYNAALIQSMLPPEPCVPKQSAHGTLPNALFRARVREWSAPWLGGERSFLNGDEKNSAPKADLQEESCAIMQKHDHS